MRLLVLLVTLALLGTVRPPPSKLYPLDFSRLQRVMHQRPEILDDNLHIGLYKQSAKPLPNSYESWKGRKGVGPKLNIFYMTIVNDGLGLFGEREENTVRVVIPRPQLRQLKRDLISQVVRFELNKKECQTLKGWRMEDWKATDDIERLGIVLRLPKDMKHDPQWPWSEAESCILDLQRETDGIRSLKNWLDSNVVDFYTTATRIYPPIMEKGPYGLLRLVTRLSEAQYSQIRETIKTKMSEAPTAMEKTEAERKK